MASCEFYAASEEYADFILRYSANSAEQLYELARTRCFSFINQEFAVIHAVRSRIAPMSVAAYSYGAIPKLYGLLDMTALESSGIPTVFNQPALTATGRGVIIGFIDTGIDYTNPLFRNADGSSRILGIWDQTLPDPALQDADGLFLPYYGTEFTREDIDAALASDQPYARVPSRDTDGHGTFMAGVAAGRRVEAPVAFSGAAPEAALAVVKLKPAKQYLRDFFLIREGVPAYQENDIMAAVSYLLRLANQYRMPIVIYIGVGTAQGSHDGTSPLGRQLLNLTGYPGLAVVTGAGNETGYHHHYFGSVAPDQTYADVELRVGADEQGFCLELWATQPELYTVGFVSPSGEVIDRIPQALGRETTIPFRLDSTSITLNYVSYEAGSGSQLIFMRFASPSPGIWHIRVYPSLALGGQFHLWLPMRGFLSDQTAFLSPDPDTTVTDPGNASMPITAATYGHTTGSLYIHSSRGYTRTGQIKPDLTAPGVDVQGPLLAPEGAYTGTSPAELRFGRRSGSSIAAAITAGATADIFTWALVDANDLNATGASANSMLIRGADRNPAFSYPNRQWGYGTLNLYQAFLRNRE